MAASAAAESLGTAGAESASAALGFSVLHVDGPSIATSVIQAPRAPPSSPPTPPPSAPPPSPPPPVQVLYATSENPLSEALSTVKRDMNGLVTEIRLGGSEHVVDSNDLLINGSAGASAITLTGDGSSVLRPSDAAEPVLVLIDGGPPVVVSGAHILGKLIVNGSSLQLVSCILNGAASAATRGRHLSDLPNAHDAAIQVNGGRVSLKKTDLTDHGAGAISVTAGTLWLSESTLARNQAPEGGAMRVSGGSVHIETCLLEENRAESGGALHVSAGDVELCDKTLLLRNDATRGRSIQLCDDASKQCSATLRYVLPAPAGR